MIAACSRTGTVLCRYARRTSLCHSALTNHPDQPQRYHIVLQQPPDGEPRRPHSVSQAVESTIGLLETDPGRARPCWRRSSLDYKVKPCSSILICDGIVLLPSQVVHSAATISHDESKVRRWVSRQDGGTAESGRVAWWINGFDDGRVGPSSQFLNPVAVRPGSSQTSNRPRRSTFGNLARCLVAGGDIDKWASRLDAPGLSRNYT